MVMVTLVTPISMTGGSVRPSIGEPPEHGTSAIVKARSLVPGSGEACGSANDHLAATGSPSSSADHRPPGAGLVTGCAAHPASSSPVSTIDAFILDPQPPCPTHRPRGPAERARPSSPSQCGTTRSAVDRRQALSRDPAAPPGGGRVGGADSRPGCGAPRPVLRARPAAGGRSPWTRCPRAPGTRFRARSRREWPWPMPRGAARCPEARNRRNGTRRTGPRCPCRAIRVRPGQDPHQRGDTGVNPRLRGSMGR